MSTCESCVRSSTGWTARPSGGEALGGRHGLLSASRPLPEQLQSYSDASPTRASVVKLT